MSKFLPKTKPHLFSHTVYFGDTDAAGVVYHANYLRFMEAARIEYLSDLGYSYKKLQDQNIGLSPVTLDIAYKSPLRFGDRFTVDTRLVKLTKVSIILKQTVLNRDTICSDSTVKLACLDERSFKVIKMPDSLFTLLEMS